MLKYLMISINQMFELKSPLVVDRQYHELLRSLLYTYLKNLKFVFKINTNEKNFIYSYSIIILSAGSAI